MLRVLFDLTGGSFGHRLWTIDRPRSEGLLFEGVGSFLTEGRNKTPLFGLTWHAA